MRASSPIAGRHTRVVATRGFGMGGGRRGGEPERAAPARTARCFAVASLLPHSLCGCTLHARTAAYHACAAWHCTSLICDTEKTPRAGNDIECNIE